MRLFFILLKSSYAVRNTNNFISSYDNYIIPEYELPLIQNNYQDMCEKTKNCTAMSYIYSNPKLNIDENSLISQNFVEKNKSNQMDKYNSQNNLNTENNGENINFYTYDSIQESYNYRNNIVPGNLNTSNNIINSQNINLPIYYNGNQNSCDLQDTSSNYNFNQDINKSQHAFLSDNMREYDYVNNQKEFSTKNQNKNFTNDTILQNNTNDFSVYAHANNFSNTTNNVTTHDQNYINNQNSIFFEKSEHRNVNYTNESHTQFFDKVNFRHNTAQNQNYTNLENDQHLNSYQNNNAISDNFCLYNQNVNTNISTPENNTYNQYSYNIEIKSRSNNLKNVFYQTPAYNYADNINVNEAHKNLAVNNTWGFDQKNFQDFENPQNIILNDNQNVDKNSKVDQNFNASFDFTCNDNTKTTKYFNNEKIFALNEIYVTENNSTIDKNYNFYGDKYSMYNNFNNPQKFTDNNNPITDNSSTINENLKINYSQNTSSFPNYNDNLYNSQINFNIAENMKNDIDFTYNLYFGVYPNNSLTENKSGYNNSYNHNTSDCFNFLSNDYTKNLSYFPNGKTYNFLEPDKEYIYSETVDINRDGFNSKKTDNKRKKTSLLSSIKDNYSKTLPPIKTPDEKNKDSNMYNEDIKIPIKMFKYFYDKKNITNDKYLKLFIPKTNNKKANYTIKIENISASFYKLIEIDIKKNTFDFTTSEMKPSNIIIKLNTLLNDLDKYLNDIKHIFKNINVFFSDIDNLKSEAKIILYILKINVERLHLVYFKLKKLNVYRVNQNNFFNEENIAYFFVIRYLFLQFLNFSNCDKNYELKIIFTEIVKKNKSFFISFIRGRKKQNLISIKSICRILERKFVNYISAL